MSKTRIRRIVFLSLLVPGLGHYNLGYRKEGALLFGIAAAFVASGSTVIHSVIFILPLVWLAQSIDAGRLARAEEKAANRAKMESERTWWD